MSPSRYMKANNVVNSYYLPPTDPCVTFLEYSKNVARPAGALNYRFGLWVIKGKGKPNVTYILNERSL